MPVSITGVVNGHTYNFAILTKDMEQYLAECGEDPREFNTVRIPFGLSRYGTVKLVLPYLGAAHTYFTFMADAFTTTTVGDNTFYTPREVVLTITDSDKAQTITLTMYLLEVGYVGAIVYVVLADKRVALQSKYTGDALRYNVPKASLFTLSTNTNYSLDSLQDVYEDGTILGSGGVAHLKGVGNVYNDLVSCLGITITADTESPSLPDDPAGTNGLIASGLPATRALDALLWTYAQRMSYNPIADTYGRYALHKERGTPNWDNGTLAFVKQALVTRSSTFKTVYPYAHGATRYPCVPFSLVLSSANTQERTPIGTFLAFKDSAGNTTTTTQSGMSGNTQAYWPCGFPTNNGDISTATGGAVCYSEQQSKPTICVGLLTDSFLFRGEYDVVGWMVTASGCYTFAERIAVSMDRPEWASIPSGFSPTSSCGIVAYKDAFGRLALASSFSGALIPVHVTSVSGAAATIIISGNDDDGHTAVHNAATYRYDFTNSAGTTYAPNAGLLDVGFFGGQVVKGTNQLPLMPSYATSAASYGMAFIGRDGKAYLYSVG